MLDNTQNTISSTAINKYNDCRSVRLEALEWFKMKNPEGRSVRIPTIRKRVEDEVLDYIKLDIMEATTSQGTDKFISAAPNLKDILHKLDILILLTINHIFYNNKVIDSTIVHRILRHAMEEKIDKMKGDCIKIMTGIIKLNKKKYISKSMLYNKKMHLHCTTNTFIKTSRA